MIQAMGGRHFIFVMVVTLLTFILQLTGHLPDSGVIFRDAVVGIGVAYCGGGAFNTYAERKGGRNDQA